MGTQRNDGRLDSDTISKNIQNIRRIKYFELIERRLKMAQRVVIPGFRKIETSGGGEGTGNYNDLQNKPSINNVPLVGNLKTVDLKLTDPTLTEEGVPAEAKTVGEKLEKQSTSLTELSEQLGSHTVKSDVPENAVFTDTVYDDTEIKESLSEQSSEMMDIKMLDGVYLKNVLYRMK